MDPKELHDPWGYGDGSIYPVIIRANRLRDVYQKSFQKFPNDDYSKMKQSR